MNCARIFSFCISLFIGCMAAGLLIEAEVLYVSTLGQDVTGCGEMSLPCGNISFAVNAAPDGATIAVLPGIYVDQVKIGTKKNLSIEATEAGSVTLQCPPPKVGIICYGITASAPFIIWGFQFAECQTAIFLDGGAIGEVVNVIQCQFKNSHQVKTGVFTAGIQAHTTMDLAVISSSFVNNSITVGGSAVAAAALYFTSPLLASHPPIVLIMDCHFQDNQILSDAGTAQLTGGVVYAGMVEKLSILNSTFSSNSIAVTTPGKENIALSGAAVYCILTTELSVIGCHFDSNELRGEGSVSTRAGAASVEGGALTAESVEIVKLLGCRFTKNSAIAGSSALSAGGNSNGGALKVYAVVNLMLHHCQFSDNSVTSGGGGPGLPPGLAMGGGAYVTFHTVLKGTGLINQTTFTDNTAESGNSFSGVNMGALVYGGGLYVSLGKSNTELTITQSTFSSNLLTALMGVEGFAPSEMIGGGVYCDASQGTVKVSNCKFEDNQIRLGQHGVVYFVGEMRGGGFASMTGHLKLTNSNVTSNFIQCNPAEGYTRLAEICEGGGLYLTSHTQIERSRITGNVVTGGVGVVCGGGIAAINHPLLVVDCDISANQAYLTNCAQWTARDQALGGAICQQTDNLVIAGGTMRYNSVSATCPNPYLGVDAVAVGGAVSACNVQCDNLVIEGNNATAGYAMGGAIIVFDILQFNSGAIMCSSANVSMNNVSLVDNHAVTRFPSQIQNSFGGGVALYRTGVGMQLLHFSAVNSTIENNSANMGGGLAVVNRPSSLTSGSDVVNCTVKGNTALVGAAVYAAQSNVSTQQGTAFVNNTAAMAGGALLFQPGNVEVGVVNGMNTSSFVGNSAVLGGGALFVAAREPQNVPVCTPHLCDNKASYGSCCASYVWILRPYCDLDRIVSVSNTTPAYTSAVGGFVWPGKVFSLCLVLQDYYNNTVITPSIVIANANREPTFSSGIPQDVISIDDFGRFSTKSASIASAPHANISIVFVGKQIRPSSIELPDSYAGVIPLNHEVNSSLSFSILPCPSGMYYSAQVQECFICSNPTFYTLDTGATSETDCVRCPNLEEGVQPCFVLRQEGPSGESGSKQEVRSNGQPSLQGFDSGDVEPLPTVTQGYWPDVVPEHYPSLLNPSFISACADAESCFPFECKWDVEDGTSYSLNCAYYNTEREAMCQSSNHFQGCCEEGYYERLCSRCICESSDECFYSVGEAECVQCSVSTTVVTVLFICIAAISLMVLALFPTNSIVLFCLENLVVFVLVLLHIVEWWWMGVSIVLLILALLSNREIPGGIVKSFIFYIQMISTLPGTNTWPEQIGSSLGAVNVLQTSGLQCILPQLASPIYAFSFELLLPWIVIALLCLVLCFSHAIRVLRRKRIIAQCLEGPSRPSQDESINSRSNREIEVDRQHGPHHSGRLMGELVSGTLFLLTVFYYDESNLILHQLQPCRDGYMPTHPWIPCLWSNTTYLTLIILAFIFLVLYVVSLPIVLAFLLFRFRERILRNDHSTESLLGFLYEDYKIEQYWYELAWIGRRLLLSFGVSLCQGYGGVIQEPFIVSVLLVSLLYHLHASPFQRRVANCMEFIGDCTLLLTYVSAPSSDAVDDWPTYVVQWSLLVLNAIVGSAYLLVMILPILQALRRKSSSLLNHRSQREEGDTHSLLLSDDDVPENVHSYESDQHDGVVEKESEEDDANASVEEVDLFS